MTPRSLLARGLLVAVTLAGGLLLAIRLPRVGLVQRAVLALLIAASLVMAALARRLPLPEPASTQPLSYAVDFVSLLVLGPDATLFVAALGALFQDHVRASELVKERRTVFPLA